MKTAGWIASIVLAALLARWAFPRTVVEYVSGPPAKPDTVYVTELETVLDTVFRDRVREVRTTDTVNLVHEVVISDTILVGTLNPRWYLNRAYIPESVGDTALVSATLLGVDEVIWRADALQKVWTPGPLRSIEADEYGIHLDFYDPPPRPRTCDIWCRSQLVLGGAAAGVLLHELLR